MSAKICDGKCAEPFIKALEKEYGVDAKLPVAFALRAGKMVSIVEPPIVSVREGRRWKRINLILPFCGLCGGKNS